MTRSGRVLVTGGNSGIGERAVAHLARSGWQVSVAARDVEKSARVASRLNRATGRAAVTVEALDLGSLASTRALAERCEDASLDAVVCNAGVSWTGPLRRTEEGFEFNVGVNFVGHFVLVRELLPSLAPGARVIVVGSGAASMTEDHDYMKAPAWPGASELLRPEADSPTMEGRRYATSKLCEMLYATELDRRLRSGALAGPADAKVAIYEPGFVPGTALARYEKGLAGWMFRRILPWMSRWVPVRTAEEAGRDLAEMVLDPELRSGIHVVEGRVADAVPPLLDPDRARELWEETERALALL